MLILNMFYDFIADDYIKQAWKAGIKGETIMDYILNTRCRIMGGAGT